MSESFQKHSATTPLFCSKAEFTQLQKLLVSIPRRLSHGFEVSYTRGDGIYLYAENFGIVDHLPKVFREALGKLIHRLGLDYLEVGYASYTSDMAPNTCCGGTWRLYRDGRVVYEKSALYPEALEAPVIDLAPAIPEPPLLP